ncbi:PepSY-associated TM helix domain-containing protein [Teredinibacter haidensis]|uniref:PepSY-associated TM helix domain-containing protein n=1 Tax=Teredinibacter haidensis TaxID=2731755 RepID=UPI000948B56C|nr:PepSY-associated TM helix domain-containing protein [Teredinibacter haidensis]
MRSFLVVLHRWSGLFMAVFLFVSGLTGAFISWDHELDAALNPEMYRSSWSGDSASALTLADQLEEDSPELVVTFLPLTVEQDHALNVFVQGRSAEEDLDYNQLAINPGSGVIQAKRMWGEASLSRENLLPFLYKLHYSMHIPDMGGVEAGVLFMGIVGIVWVIDCFVVLWISFPARRSWRKSFAFRVKSGGYKLNFDLHRSGGVWLWMFMLILAVTSVSMNLGFQVVRPAVNAISPLTPSPFESAVPKEKSSRTITREEAVNLAMSESEKLDLKAPLGGLFYSRDFNLYGVGFFQPGNGHGDGGLGNPWLYFSAEDGRYLGATIPGQGSAGDIFMQAQFPLHSGRILGVTGRVIVSLLGLAVAGLSVTGVVIWIRKRTARRGRAVYAR